jgi:hypothetical protein
MIEKNCVAFRRRDNASYTRASGLEKQEEAVCNGYTDSGEKSLIPVRTLSEERMTNEKIGYLKLLEKISKISLKRSLI